MCLVCETINGVIGIEILNWEHEANNIDVTPMKVLEFDLPKIIEITSSENGNELKGEASEQLIGIFSEHPEFKTFFEKYDIREKIIREGVTVAWVFKIYPAIANLNGLLTYLMELIKNDSLLIARKFPLAAAITYFGFRRISQPIIARNIIKRAAFTDFIKNKFFLEECEIKLRNLGPESFGRPNFDAKICERRLTPNDPAITRFYYNNLTIGDVLRSTGPMSSTPRSKHHTEFRTEEDQLAHIPLKLDNHPEGYELPVITIKEEDSCPSSFFEDSTSTSHQSTSRDTCSTPPPPLLSTDDSTNSEGNVVLYESSIYGNNTGESSSSEPRNVLNSSDIPLNVTCGSSIFCDQTRGNYGRGNSIFEENTEIIEVVDLTGNEGGEEVEVFEDEDENDEGNKMQTGYFLRKGRKRSSDDTTRADKGEKEKAPEIIDLD